MVISEFGQAREMSLVRHSELGKNPGRVAENPGERSQLSGEATLFGQENKAPAPIADKRS